jgi:hypothetical protein
MTFQKDMLYWMNANSRFIQNFKISGLNFDLLTSSYNQGILSWMTQGWMDIECLYTLPLEYSDVPM